MNVLVTKGDIAKEGLEDLIFWKNEGASEEKLLDIIDQLEMTQYVDVLIDDGTPPS